MTAVPVESQSWSPLKWAVVAACMLALQGVFFFWFARPPGLPPHPRSVGLAIVMPDGHPADLPGSVSPLVLVRPDAHGFSGRAWLQIPPVAYNPRQSNPPPFILQPEIGRFGTAITESLSHDLSPHFEVASMPGPRFDPMNYSPNPVAPVLESTLTIEGELAGRPLLNRPVLKLQPADTILPYTVVHVVVDAGGRVFAPPVLETKVQPGTSTSADADALAVAANLLFKPLARVPGPSRPDSASLTPGRLVFRWQTVPKTAPAFDDPTGIR
ncbi:MAG TPA: hypothetical protein VN048_13495 [Verrucomicrobiae bacterium]|jgi:hypothetical protein|nr:hypothetical protein [Verrucomicrobiae bacterium]